MMMTVYIKRSYKPITDRKKCKDGEFMLFELDENKPLKGYNYQLIGILQNNYKLICNDEMLLKGDIEMIW